MIVDDGWTVNPNLFIVQVADKGDGKTPANRLTFGELTQLEKDDKATHDKEVNEKIRQAKKRARRDVDQAGDVDQTGDVDEAGDSSTSRKTDEVKEEAKLFHKKTRLAESLTIEALYLTLEHGSRNLVLKYDEFKVSYIDKP